MRVREWVVGSVEVCVHILLPPVKYVADVGLRIMIRKGDCDVNGVDVAVATLFKRVNACMNHVPITPI